MDKKYCSECKTWKDPLTEFHKNGSRPDGRSAYCKTCRSKRSTNDYEQDARGITLEDGKAIYAGLPTDCKQTIDELANEFINQLKKKRDRSPNVGIHGARATIFSIIEWMSKQAP